MEIHQHLGSLKHVINIIMWIRDTGCYNPPLKQNLIPRFKKEKGSKRDNEQSHIPCLRQLEVWMTRTEEIFTLPCCFFFRMVASSDLVELDHFAPCDTTLLVKDLDRMFRICQIRVEWCLQAFL
jgi:hypothetical protein